MSRVAARRPWIIAHRGASAWRPEHTLAAYALAIGQGADAIEPDLVLTRDGVLVARHGNELSESTDVAGHPDFAARRGRREVDGEILEGWFTEDFTLEELRRLRAREPLPGLRGRAHDGVHAVATFDEILALLAREVDARGRAIGLVPELKHPSHFAARGLDLEAALVRALAAHDIARRVPLWLQCFEPGTLRRLRAVFPRGGNVRLLQLVGHPLARPADVVRAGGDTTYAHLLAPDGRQGVAAFADGLGLPKSLLAPRATPDGPRCDLVEAVHAAGLQVFAYTYRPENAFLPPHLREGEDPAARPATGLRAEVAEAAAIGVDAVFTDDPSALATA